MNCENYLCVYQSDGQCLLKEISLDQTGSCLACIYPDIEPAVLEQAKTDFLKKQEETEAL